jgi:hypothetical protein
MIAAKETMTNGANEGKIGITGMTGTSEGMIETSVMIEGTIEITETSVMIEDRITVRITVMLLLTAKTKETVGANRYQTKN